VKDDPQRRIASGRWWHKWWQRHRWLLAYPPTVDDGLAGENDPATDPLRFEFGAERGYDKRGRLGDKEWTEDQIDV
jgi:hypothetical protein